MLIVFLIVAMLPVFVRLCRTLHPCARSEIQKWLRGSYRTGPKFTAKYQWWAITCTCCSQIWITRTLFCMSAWGATTRFYFWFCLIRTTIDVSGSRPNKLLNNWFWRWVAALPRFWRAWWDTGFCLSATLIHRLLQLHVRPFRLLSPLPRSQKLSTSARTRSLTWVIMTTV